MASFILVLNCGSSSIKFSVVNPVSGAVKLKGLVESLGSPLANLAWETADKKHRQDLAKADYPLAIHAILELLEMQQLSSAIIGVGHRVVHGGERFSASVLIDDSVIEYLKSCSHLAPLHNPAHLQGIERARQEFPQLPQVAVFDTAFHQQMPAHAYLYALPEQFYEEYQVRRYGFHGTSYRYVLQRSLQLLELSPTDNALILAHLGNGCSVVSVLNGISIDTSMGMTPLEGLIMGTRTGDIDPGIPAYLAKECGYSLADIDELFNQHSGLLGISGLSQDMRELQLAAEQGDKKAELAITMFCYHLAKYIGAMATTLPRLDALVFTGGIGENSALVRAKTLQQLKILGFTLAEDANTIHGAQSQGLITKAGCTPALVVATNEEWMIAQDTLQLIQAN